MSSERGLKISAAKMGHAVSEETRAKIRLALKGRAHQPFERRFWAKVRKSEGCWLWLGALNAAGYGVFHRLDDGTRLAYRIAFELTRGPIPTGLELDHLCRVRSCVNPAHLEPVTRHENILRSIGPALTRARRRLAIAAGKRGAPTVGQ